MRRSCENFQKNFFQKNGMGLKTRGVAPGFKPHAQVSLKMEKNQFLGRIAPLTQFFHFFRFFEKMTPQTQFSIFSIFWKNDPPLKKIPPEKKIQKIEN